MGLIDSRYFGDEHPIPYNFVKCRVGMADMQTVNLDTVPEFQKFFISRFTREGIIFQDPEPGSDDSSALVVLRIDKCDCVNIDANLKLHNLISESGTNLPRFIIRSVSSINFCSESLCINSWITSS